MTSGSNHGKQHPWCSRALPPSAAAAAAAAAAEVRKKLPGGADLEDDFVTVAAQTTDATNPAIVALADMLSSGTDPILAWSF
jgi:hypothetical protein